MTEQTNNVPQQPVEPIREYFNKDIIDRMAAIKREREHLTAEHLLQVKAVLSPQQAEDLFERLMKVFDGFVGVPQSSAGTIFASGVYMETGGWLVLQTSHDSPPGIQLHDTGGLDAGAVVAEFVNY